MPARAATDPDHPDPSLRPRLFVAEPGQVFEVLRSALDEEGGWSLSEADADAGLLVGARRRLLPPGREEVTVHVEAHDEKTVLVTGEAARSGLLPFRWQAREALKQVLRAADGLFRRAEDTPLRTEGYD